MIKGVNLNYDLSVFLDADYEQHHGSCISYQTVEQKDIHEIAGGFPKTYTEDNTRIQQLWFNNEDVDYNELGLSLIHI